MPLISTTHDSLPYIDAPPSPRSLTSARDLITSSLNLPASPPPHPSLPALPPPGFTPLLTAELARIATSTRLTAIDTTRYEAPSSLTPNTLREAYISSSYLAHRHQTLALLEQFGKNAWLVHNSQLEDLLRSLEKEVVETREAVEGMNRERKREQEGRRGEVEGAGREWREGVGRCLEVGIAVGEVEERIRDAMREGR